MENRLLIERNKVQELSLQQKNLLIYSLIAITVLILALIALLYSRFNNKQKAHKELEEKNNGTIWVENEYNSGSKFRFILPTSSISD